MRTIIAFLLTLLVSTTYAGNCIFKPETDCVERLKIYLDREGSIYPPTELHTIQSGLFFNPKNGKDNTSKLSVYFNNAPDALLKIGNNLGIGPDFDALQNYLIEGYARKINQEVRQGKKIVFLIHGFNSDQEESKASFETLRNQFNDGKNITIVEVYWDGLTKSPLRIWSKAQPNSVYAGLKVRKLLTNVDQRAKIVLLTHSLGASVATHALFNVTKSTSKFQIQVDVLSKSIPTPAQEYIVLSMIAPAIPGTNTFKDINSITENNTQQHIKKIIVGYNTYDYALIKGIGIRKHIGATSLGCSVKEINDTRDLLFSMAPQITFKQIDLSDKPKRSEHSVKEYVLAKLFGNFITETFTD